MDRFVEAGTPRIVAEHPADLADALVGRCSPVEVLFPPQHVTEFLPGHEVLPSLLSTLSGRLPGPAELYNLAFVFEPLAFATLPRSVEREAGAVQGTSRRS